MKPLLSTLSKDPNIQKSLRTYAISLSLSLGPSLIPVIASLNRPAHSAKILKKVLKRELSPTGFAFALTVIIGGGGATAKLWEALESAYRQDNLKQPWLQAVSHRFSSAQKAFLSNVLSSTVGIILLQAGRRTAKNLPSPTLDLTLLLFVRAMDVFIQSYVFKQSHREYRPSADHNNRLFPDPAVLRERLEQEELKHLAEASQRREKLRTRIDGGLFWICTARIMWCFFYEPQRLPPSYVQWISRLAAIDGRLTTVLQLVRKGEWSYISGSASHRRLLMEYAQDLGYPAAWGDPNQLPAYSHSANQTWKAIGLPSPRPGVGGLPCELVHGSVGMGLEGSCTANAGMRGLTALVKALGIYLPAHFLPILLTRPRVLLRPHRVLLTTLGALRSATFLSTFLSTCFYSICLTRTLVLPKVFPWISHDFWDGPYGCVLVGSIMAGSSIWIENGRRRGEMALYVLPKAVRSILPNRWLRSGRSGVLLAERLTFVLSMASLLTAGTHNPDALRGLSRWTLSFVMNGSNAGFWKRRKRMIDPSMPATPTVPQTPVTMSQTSPTQSLLDASPITRTN